MLLATVALGLGCAAPVVGDTGEPDNAGVQDAGSGTDAGSRPDARERRPDLFEKLELTKDDRKLLATPEEAL
ncbi:MAG: hypothetical protein AB1730_28635 [Myxococcota bacterium]